MLGNSILGRLYGWWLYSAIFRILRGIYRPFSRAFPHSAVVRFLRRSPKVEVWYRASLFTRIVDAGMELPAAGVRSHLPGICALRRRQAS